jgi:glucose/arabinose dehydrogenase
MPMSTARSLVLACVAATAACTHRAPPPPIHAQRVAIAIEDFVQVPPSSPTPPRARINDLHAAPDGSGRLFVADMTGIIYVIHDGHLRPEPFLDLRKARAGHFTDAHLFEEGLNTFAFHPDFARAGAPGFRRLYTFSTERRGSGPPTFAAPIPTTSSSHDDVVIEWTVDARDNDAVDPASAREVLRIPHPRHDHVGGQLAFDPVAKPGEPDYGMLYMGIGDGGNTVFEGGEVDKWRTAQNRALPLGKILRIDPLEKAGRPYSAPADNPFRADPGALAEVWAYGLRNPERFSWDVGGAHAMLIADIGQSQLEEIDVGHAGANYGWSEREGDGMVSHHEPTKRLPRPLFDLMNGYTYPALTYGHHLGLAVTGGYVYRGEALAQLRGLYVFGDIASGRIFGADVAGLADGSHAPFYELPLSQGGRPRTLLQIVDAPRADLRFGLDDRGEIYVLTKQDGMIRRLAAVVSAESSIRPVDRPDDVLEPASFMTPAYQRIEATLRQLIGRN